MCFAMRSSMPYTQSFFCKVDSNTQITLGNIPKKSWLMQFVLTSVAKSANFNYILLISINICDIFTLRFLLWTQTQKSLSNQKLLSQCRSRYFPDLCTSDDCLLTACWLPTNYVPDDWHLPAYLSRISPDYNRKTIEGYRAFDVELLMLFLTVHAVDQYEKKLRVQTAQL